MLAVHGLTRTFSGKTAVQDVSFVIPPGSFVAVVGRSGAGKSTLLRMMNRLVDPSAGSIAWDGTDVTRLRGRELRAWRARCAMIFQQFNLVGRLDALNNVLMGRLHDMPAGRGLLRLWRAADIGLALSALEQFDMADYAAQPVESLSGGQQQRVAIARALIQRPEIILADEPIASLDPRNTKIVMDALQRINRHFGITIVCNLHSLELARRYCDRILGMAHGRLVFDGATEAFTADAARDLYGIEAAEAMGDSFERPAPVLVGQPALAH